MATTSSRELKSAGKKAANEVKQAARKPWVTWLAKLGYIVRGLLYIIMGLLALRLAFGVTGGEATDTTGALDFIAHQPWGKGVLLVMIVGLAGYSLWGFVRALLDPLGRGTDIKGLTARAGNLVSGLSYGLLIIPAVKLLQNQEKVASTGTPQGIAQKLMSQPAGVWLVAGFGLFWILSAFGQWQLAWKKSFMEDLRLGKMSADEEKAAERIGQVGFAARGVVYALVGLFLLQAAATADAVVAQGFDGVLLKLTQQPYGHWLLGVVAFGLVLFGVFSVMCARWYRTGPSSR